MPSANTRRNSPKRKSILKKNGTRKNGRPKMVEFKGETEEVLFKIANAPQEVAKAERYLEKMLEEEKDTRGKAPVLHGRDKRRLYAIIKAFRHEFPEVNLPTEITLEHMQLMQEQLALLAMERKIYRVSHKINVPEKIHYPREERNVNLNIALEGHLLRNIPRSARQLESRHIRTIENAYMRAKKHEENVRDILKNM
jgi:hypothetical protein